MSKLLTVFGATGNQGGSVIKSVLAHSQLSKIYKIRGVTRDASKPAAVALKEKGVEVVTADMNDKQSVHDAIKGSSVVFGVTNFWEKMDGNVEFEQGKLLADASKEANVERFIFSSLPYVSKETNGKLSGMTHFDSKAKVEEYAREIGVPGTYFMPGPFMSFMFDNFKKDESGAYAISTPIDPKAQVHLIDVKEDAGNFVAAVLLQLPETLNKRVLGTAGTITPTQLVEDFKAATGKDAKLVHISYETFKSFLPPPVADELTENMQLIESPGYYVGEPESAVQESIDLVVKAGLHKPTTWKEYVTKSFKG